MTRIKTSKWPAALFAGLAAVLLSSAASAKNIKITTVDCSDPEQTLAGALSTIPLHFVNEIHFTGTCGEDLDIGLDYVALIGDGFSSTIEGHVWIGGANNVSLDGFNLTVDDGDTGVQASMGASVRITDVTINGGEEAGAETIGIQVLNGSAARIQNVHVTVAGIDAAALVVSNGAMARLRGGSTFEAILVLDPEEENVAIEVADASSLHQGGDEDVIIGGMNIISNSYVRMRDVNITGNIGINRHSGLRLRDDSAGNTVVGDVRILRDSYAFLEGRSNGRSVVITGDVVCFDTESSLQLDTRRGDVNYADTDCTNFNQPEPESSE